MKKIIIASNNQNKIKEYKQILKEYEVLSLEDIGFLEDIEETGSTFEENATIKAKAVYSYLKEKKISAEILADDSGLCVNSLNGEPGVYSARYSGVHGNSAANRQLILEKLKNFKDRSAYFICCIAKLDESGNLVICKGRTDGIILEKEEGYTGFGYDCIFYSTDLKKCFGLATPDEKNSVSHRFRALQELKKICKVA